MPKRWAIGGIWAILTAAEMLACGRFALAQVTASPGKVLISEVIITGNQRVSTEQIKSHLQTQPGSEYNPAKIDDDVRELYKTNQFSNIITLQKDDGPGKAIVYFSVREMPNIVQTVTFLGAKHLKTDELQNITGVRPGMPLNPNLNRHGCQRIMYKYAEMGRSFADCQLIKGGDFADTEVVYQITEGAKIRVRDIQFIGNSFVTAARLKSQLKSSPHWHNLPGSTYNKEKAEADVGELCKYFGSFGYQDVKVSLETHRSADGREVTLIFHIQEGPRYRLKDAPDVHGSQAISRKQLIAFSVLKPGDYLDEAKIRTDIDLITSYLGYAGLDARVVAIPVWLPDSPGTCNVRFEIFEKPFRDNPQAKHKRTKSPE